MNKQMAAKALLLCGALAILNLPASFAQTDTLRVLSYNVLYLGDTPPCQDPHDVLEGYLESVIAYNNPDIVGLVKMEAGGAYGTQPAGFADSLLLYSFNAAFPGRFAGCEATNYAGATNITRLYYNQQKLGFAAILCTYTDQTDFDTYKLFYKSPDLATTHDSIFLYVTLNHTNSGSSGSDATERSEQITGEMTQIETHFAALPNMINMGDFNVHTSTEAAYQTLVAPSNLNYRYYDPPFYPDATFSYPANWDDNPADYASYLTVSTRTGSAPNTCSNDNGGGKSWYDHIFLSANIINAAAHISYVPHSFKVIGNDGNRLANPENGPPANTSAPADVVNAIYQLSEHYPITLDLLVNTSSTSVKNVSTAEQTVSIANPILSQLSLQFAGRLVGHTVSIACIDMLGRLAENNTLTVTNGVMALPCNLVPGVYNIKITEGSYVIANIMASKK